MHPLFRFFELVAKFAGRPQIGERSGLDAIEHAFGRAEVAALDHQAKPTQDVRMGFSKPRPSSRRGGAVTDRRELDSVAASGGWRNRREPARQRRLRLAWGTGRLGRSIRCVGRGFRLLRRFGNVGFRCRPCWTWRWCQGGRPGGRCAPKVAPIVAAGSGSRSLELGVRDWAPAAEGAFPGAATGVRLAATCGSDQAGYKPVCRGWERACHLAARV